MLRKRPRSLKRSPRCTIYCALLPPVWPADGSTVRSKDMLLPVDHFLKRIFL